MANKRRIERLFSKTKRAYAFRCSEDALIQSSSSGGAFPLMALSVLDGKGVVFGARLCPDGVVRHSWIESADDLGLLQGSKYVQSSMGDCKSQCLDFLKNGKTVLFTGTPCQVAALRNYLDSNDATESMTRRLYTVDLICHGTPSGELFAAYLEWLRKKHKADSPIRGFSFRQKSAGWGLYYYYYYYRNGRKVEVAGEAPYDPYYSAFLRADIYRDCCYRCPFSRRERVGDVTIGDFWGIEKFHPEMYDRRGVSAVLVNTEKGAELFDSLPIGSYVSESATVEEIASCNHNLNQPSKRTEAGEKLAAAVSSAVKEGDYDEVFDGLLKPKLSMKMKVRGLLPMKMRMAIQRFRNS